jgi:hypothetical protein
MTTLFTQHLRIPKATFAEDPWHQDFWAALDQIDSLIYNVLLASSTNVWVNNHLYEAGDAAIDSSAGRVYVSLVSHTSAVAGNFAADRAAHPTYWTQLVAGLNPKGAWTHSTAYSLFDVVYSTADGVIALCITPHTSNSAGTIRTDASNWAFIVDFTTVATATGISITPTGNVAATNVQAAIAELDSEKVAKGTALAANVDFNSILTPGYYFTRDINSSNAPATATIWYVEVEISADPTLYLVQRAIAADTASPDIWVRLRNNGTWLSWRKVLSAADLGTAADIRANANAKIVTIDQAWLSNAWIDLGNVTGAVALDANAGLNYKFTMIGNVTVSVTNLKNGQQIGFAAKQDATGGRTLSWSGMSFPNNQAPAITTTASAWALIGTISDIANGAIKLVTGFHL